MSLEPITDPEAVPIGLLRRYLATHGWRAGADGRSSPGGPAVRNQAVMRAMLKARLGGQRRFDLYVLSEDGYVLSEDGADDVEIVLPREPTASDFQNRITGAIRTLSDVEGRDPEQVIADVRLIGYDVMRSRIPNMLVRDDSIHLQVAANYTNGVHSLLTATATTEMEPQPYAAKLLRTEFAPRPEKVVGRVTKLESDADPSDLLNPKGEREVAVQWDSDDLGRIDVKISLGAEDYLRAVEAHKNGRQVGVSGTLVRPKRSWFLVDPSDFRAP